MVVALTALLSSVGIGRAQTSLFEQQIPASDVAAALHQALAGVQVHLHNFGPLKGGSYHAANASSIKWPAKDGPGLRERFTLPDASRVVIGRRYGYYINHLRADGIFVAPQTDRLTATLLLKSNGPSLVGKCAVAAKAETPCGVGGESAMPEIAWKDARIDVDLVPIAYRGSLAFEATNVAISGSVDVGAVCNWPVVGAKLCAMLNNAVQSTRKKIASEVRLSLNDEQVKRGIASAVREYLDKTAQVPVLGVKRVSMQDGFVRVALGIGR